jgi:hypothetical protein
MAKVEIIRTSPCREKGISDEAFLYVKQFFFERNQYLKGPLWRKVSIKEGH